MTNAGKGVFGTIVSGRMEASRSGQTNGIDQANGYEAEKQTNVCDTERQTPAPLEVLAKVPKTAQNAPILPL